MILFLGFFGLHFEKWYLKNTNSHFGPSIPMLQNSYEIYFSPSWKRDNFFEDEVIGVLGLSENRLFEGETIFSIEEFG